MTDEELHKIVKAWANNPSDGGLFELACAVAAAERDRCIAYLNQAIECAPPFDGTRAVLRRIVDRMSAEKGGR